MHLVVNNLLTTVLIGIAVVSVGTGLHAAVPAGVRMTIAGQAHWLQLIEAVVIAEMAGYWAHRSAHTIPALWRFHKVHHSITDMDWLAAGRVHPIDQGFTKSCTILPLFILGFGRATFGALLIFFSLQALFIHANLRFRFGPSRWVISTPEFHHWHHSSDPAAYNSNFAGEFPWIDLLFGTMHLPKRQMPAAYGMNEEAPDGYLRQMAWPFRRGGLVRGRRIARGLRCRGRTRARRGSVCARGRCCGAG